MEGGGRLGRVPDDLGGGRLVLDGGPGSGTWERIRGLVRI